MAKQRTYTRARNIFLIAFILSTIIALILLLISRPLLLFSRPQDPGEPTGEDGWSLGTVIATATSCMTSVITLAGFISTTLLSWRKERRAQAAAELERQRREIDLERQRLELERLRQQQPGGDEEGES